MFWALKKAKSNEKLKRSSVFQTQEPERTFEIARRAIDMDNGEAIISECVVGCSSDF